MVSWFEYRVFVYYYVQIEQSIDAIEPRVRSFFARFPMWAESAYREGEDLRASITVGKGPAALAKTVRLGIGEPSTIDQEISIPIVWEASGPTGLFPKMEGHLIFATIGPEYTQLSFRGSYDPPMGAIGRAFDKVLMHRLAESSVKGFVDRIAAALEQ